MSLTNTQAQFLCWLSPSPS